MFTGIVEEVGTVRRLDFDDPLEGLVIDARTVTQETGVGDSIAVNGACLTVTRVEPELFAVGVMPETLRRTALGGLVPGDAVNLERALRPSSRMGGHFVQGHVDGIGTVTSVLNDGTALAVTIQPPTRLLRYIVEKGFVAVDGISLTVTGVEDVSFTIALIPYTQGAVGRAVQRTGSHVNLEVDILAKYVERLVVH